MAKIRLGTDEIKYMAMFESMTGATVKDCVTEESAMGFLIKEGDMGLAIGRKGANIERVRQAVGKSVWVMESAAEPARLIKNMFHPFNVKRVRFEDDGSEEQTAVIEVRRNDRKRVIGQDGVRIKIAKQLAKRHLGIDNISVQVV